MNCKPGDLARIINCHSTLMQGVVDRMVTVTTTFPNPLTGEAMWRYSKPLLFCGCGCRGTIGSISDDCLRPIRPAGDDEPTQETRKLPADAGIQQLRETVRAFKAMRDAGVCP